MSDIPDFSKYCEKACRKAWGEPTRETTKELRWTNGDAYGGKTYNRQKRVWYDRDLQVGGSTLDLVAHHKGEKLKKLSGAEFFEVWREAHKLGYIPEPPDEIKERPPIRRTYPYYDENGELLFEVVRFASEDKELKFRQRCPDGNGGWTWKTKGIRKVLYRLPDLIEGISQERPVLVCEGEHDADTARELGYVATTAPGGAEKPWQSEYSETLRDADVIIVSDNDANGRGQKHADNVARILHDGVAKRVRVIVFPVKDLSDWVVGGGNREQLDQLIEAAPDYVASEKPRTTSKADGEDAIALRFAEQHSETFRYIAASNEWMRWQQLRWRSEETLAAFDTSRKLCREAGDAKAKTVAAVVTLARSDRRIAATSDQWDADPMILTGPDFTVELSSGACRPPRRDDFCTKQTAVSAAPPGTAHPRWSTFLDHVLAGDIELIGFMQRFLGYCLTGYTHEHVFMFLHGKGANGKGVFVKTVSEILGDYAIGSLMETFLAARIDRHPVEIAALKGARLVVAQETQRGRSWDEAKIKTLTSSDKLTGRFMRGNPFDFEPSHKLLFTGNYKPTIRSTDEAMRRRLLLVPFTVQIPPSQRDPHLAEKLKPEWPAILRWMVDGCLEWQRGGLKVPESVRTATDEYLADQDTLRQWADECLVNDPFAFTASKMLFASWKAWCDERNLSPGTETGFADSFADRGYERRRTNSARGFKGISLR